MGTMGIVQESPAPSEGMAPRSPERDLLLSPALTNKCQIWDAHRDLQGMLEVAVRMFVKCDHNYGEE